DAVGTFIGAPVEMWLPERALPIDPRGGAQVLGRLAPSTSRSQAQAELQAVASRILHDRGETTVPWTIELVPGTLLHGGQRAGASVLFLILFAVVVLVLAVACANVANLLLAGILSRRRELGVRVAIGASRARIVQQLVVESGLVTLAGSFAGLLA